MASKTPTRDLYSLPKYSPRAAAPVEAAPAAASSPSKVATSQPRFSSSGGARSPFSPTASPHSPIGSTLFVPGLAKSPVRGDGQTSAFRSTTSAGDAHIKSLGYMSNVPFRAAPTVSPRGGTAAFRSTSPSDRDSHIRDVSQRFTATGGASASLGSPTARSAQLPTASYRSGSPIACAHVQALPKPVDASYRITGAFGSPSAASVLGSPSAAYRSGTSIADAHIKALPKMGDGLADTKPGSVRGCSSPFKSGTSIADAHIKAVPKPVDVLLAYQE